MPSKGQRHTAEARERIARGTKYGQAKRRALSRVAPGEFLELERTGNIAAGPHAVTSLETPTGTRHYGYDANGNMTCRGSSAAGSCGDGTQIAYSEFNKPTQISAPNGAQSSFMYGPDNERVRQTAINGGTTTTTIYVGSDYETETENGSTKMVHHIFADGVAVAQYHRIQSTTNDSWRYLHRDHIGSIIATTDEAGTVTQRMDFEPHGARSATAGSTEFDVTRGFTGHEHLEGVGIIHMNGRVYDPELGRMLSPDPYIVEPYDLQTYNRYSYVHNNPLTLTDPSGYWTPNWFSNFIGSILRSVSLETNTKGGTGSGSGSLNKKARRANRGSQRGKRSITTTASGGEVEWDGARWGTGPDGNTRPQGEPPTPDTKVPTPTPGIEVIVITAPRPQLACGPLTPACIAITASALRAAAMSPAGGALITRAGIAAGTFGTMIHFTIEQGWDVLQHSGEGGEEESAEPFAEDFPTFEGAVGEVEGDSIGDIEKVPANNPGAIAQGYSEKWIGNDKNGERVSAFRNPSTGRFSGGKASSGLP